MNGGLFCLLTFLAKSQNTELQYIKIAGQRVHANDSSIPSHLQKLDRNHKLQS